MEKYILLDDQARKPAAVNEITKFVMHAVPPRVPVDGWPTKGAGEKNEERYQYHLMTPRGKGSPAGHISVLH
jgi:hypothetical protein